MAKNKKRKRRPPVTPQTSASAGTVAGDEPGDDRLDPSSRSYDDSGPSEPASGGDRGRVPGYSVAVSSGGGGFFAVYKSGQGYYTRLGTAIGGGLIAFFGAHYIYGRLDGSTPAFQLGIPSAVLAVTGLILFWITGSGRKSNDFFIATEGEMKKVNWSNRKEVVGSTKVVLVFTLFMASFLFAVDILFLLFFSSINVLQTDLKSLTGFGF